MTEPLVRHRTTFTDERGRRVASGYVVYTTRHAASDPNTPELRHRVDLVNGVADVRLPANTYLLIARLLTTDGRWLDRTDHLTLEDS